MPARHLLVGGGEAFIGSRQRRGEHAERVVRQLVCVDDRIHAERGEQVGDVGELAQVSQNPERRFMTVAALDTVPP